MKRLTVTSLVTGCLLLATAAVQAGPSKSPDASVSSPQVCPPSGYLEVPPEARPVQQKGELLYCAREASTEWWKRSKCAKYVPAQEYIKIASGRADAVYSGMALRGAEQQPTIVLFYCLPAR